MDSHLPSIRRRAVFGGVLVDILLIAVATIPVKMRPTSASVLSVYFIGFIGGGVAGKLTENGERMGIWHGFVSGAIGGSIFGGILVYTFLLNETRGLFWAINYWLLVTIPFPLGLLADYGRLIVVTIGVASALGFTVASTVAGGLTASPRQLVRATDW